MHARSRRLFAGLVLLVMMGDPSAAGAQVLVFQDGTEFEISEYRVADGVITYRNFSGGKNSIPLTQVDIEQTRQANARRGTAIDFTPKPPLEKPTEKQQEIAQGVAADTGGASANPLPAFSLAQIIPPRVPINIPPLISNDNLSEILQNARPLSAFVPPAGALMSPMTLAERRRREDIKWRKKITDQVNKSQANKHARMPLPSPENFPTPEAYWRHRLQLARWDVRIYELHIQELQHRIKTAWMTESDDSYWSHIGYLSWQIELRQDQLQQAQQALTDLTWDMHRTGGLPGWLR